MRFLLFVALLALAGCAGTGAGSSEPAPTGSWRGTLVPLDAGRSLPATLYLSEGGTSLIAGAARVSGSEAVRRGPRIEFTVDQFPVTTRLRRPLRCSLLLDGPQGMSGMCRASTSRYELRLVRSLS